MGTKTKIFVALYGLLVIVVAVFAFQQKWPSPGQENAGTNNSTAPNPTANWLTYTDSTNGFSLKYPPQGFPELSSAVVPPNKSAAKLLLIHHSIPVEHCDLSGIPAHCQPNTDDLSVGLYVFPKSFTQIRASLEKAYKGLLEDNMLYPGMRGAKLAMGAEGEAVTYYYLDLAPAKTLVIIHKTLDEHILSNYQDAQDFIAFDQQNKLFQQMLSTVNFK